MTPAAAAPRVSVVIPTYSRAALVVEAITSVLAQTYRDLEVIVCDDGSDDDTGERVRAFGPPVRYVRIAHTAAPGIAMNRGVAEARGEMVAFLDDDDLWDERKLGLQVELLEARPELDCVYCDCRVVDPDGSRTRVVPAPSPDRSGWLMQRVLAGEIPSSCALLVRRGALARATGFDEEARPGYDFVFWLGLARVARVARLPEPLTLVRQQHASQSKSPERMLGTYVGALERELGAADLTLAQRFRCRRTLASHYAKLAVGLGEAGESAAARSAALRGLRLFPASRTAWRAAARAWMN